MQARKLFILTLALPAIAAGTTPGCPPCALVDRIMASASSQPDVDTALGLLERIAEGHADTIEPDLEKQVGALPGEFKTSWYKNSVLIDYALWRIGETGLPEAVDFLTKFEPHDLPAAKRALKNATLKTIPDPQKKIEFLTNILLEYRRRDSDLERWGADELCNLGASSALPEIRRSLKSIWSGYGEEDEVRFCEARIEALSRDPDRTRALGMVLGSALALDGSPDGMKLLKWAIGQLFLIRTPEADAELERIASNLEAQAKAFPADPQLPELLRQAEYIRVIHPK